MNNRRYLIIGILIPFLYCCISACSNDSTINHTNPHTPNITIRTMPTKAGLNDSIIAPIALVKLPTTAKQIKEWFITHFFDKNSVALDDLNLKKYKSDYLLDNKQKADVYTLNLIGQDYPTAWQRNYTLLLLKDKQQIFVLKTDSLIHIFTQKKENRITFGGIYTPRDRSYFAIYTYSNNRILTLFDTATHQDNECKGGLMIGYHRSDACVEYQPNKFIFSQIDFNRDGYLDIIFRGKIRVFCEGIESRTKDIPLKYKNITIVFEYNSKSHNWYLKDKTICKDLNFME